ncbi:hypothetical protein P0Y35_18010 [Kiritimatiellaeota bacterium B1221]|nr:hypothetical protein [Kiritimatiellaeota bacterium B1221]
MIDHSIRLQALLTKGVCIPHPSSVYVADDVNVDRIHETAVIHPGSRLQGETLSVGPGAEIGKECPATVINCQLGADVSLKGGYFEGSVFLDRSSVGSSAHVRPGCLLEEEACAAHAVGLKQTILFPFVTLGSLINFCDVLMAGGTSRKNHSEVGSSFIHFNFTPHNDKATGSLIGDVARGVLLNEAPIFLGGQGGIVGPVEMEYGVVQAAGSICRQDLLEEDHLFQSAVTKERWAPYKTGAIREPEEKWRKNIKYIASLQGLMGWYEAVRVPVMSADPFTRRCLDAAVHLLKASVAERVKQLKKWCGKLPAEVWEPRFAALELRLQSSADTSLLERVVKDLKPADDYVESIRALTPLQQQQVQQFFELEIQRCSVLTESL